MENFRIVVVLAFPRKNITRKRCCLRDERRHFSLMFSRYFTAKMITSAIHCYRLKEKPCALFELRASVTKAKSIKRIWFCNWVNRLACDEKTLPGIVSVHREEDEKGKFFSLLFRLPSSLFHSFINSLVSLAFLPILNANAGINDMTSGAVNEPLNIKQFIKTHHKKLFDILNMLSTTAWNFHDNKLLFLMLLVLLIPTEKRTLLRL